MRDKAYLTATILECSWMVCLETPSSQPVSTYISAPKYGPGFVAGSALGRSFLNRLYFKEGHLMARLVSINVGLPRDVTWRGQKVHTAIWKQPVQGRISFHRLTVPGH